ncbi:MAG TPA: xylose isomerase [Trinickia sp.]|nr:xylose isomerase [Trinickia sp.]
MTSLQIGVNIDGVLHHDGLPFPDTATRFQMIAEAGVFDYVEKNPQPGEDLAPCVGLCERYGLPLRVIGGIFRAGRDEAQLATVIEWATRFGSKIVNCQLYAHHADGHCLTDAEVAAFYATACEWADKAGCVPSLEVHVDMWSEDFGRVASVAERLARDGIALRLTLDHSHLIFKIGNAGELHASGIRQPGEPGEIVLDPASPQAIYTQWIARGWVHHAHARSVAPNNPPNAWMQRADGRPGRGIQYPFVEPELAQWHGDWQETALAPWKLAVQQLLAHRAKGASHTPQQISCEFIPFPDYGGGARYSIFDNNVACAEWLRETWRRALVTGA